MVAAAASLLLAGAAGATPTPGTPAAPAITGSTAQGTQLTLTQAQWTSPTAATVTVTDQWYDCPTSTVSTACTPVGNGTTTYTVGTADAGKYVGVIETADDGAAPPATADSNTIGPIDPPPAPTLNSGSSPTVTGTVASGGTLTANAGSWTNSPTSYTYQWLACTGSPLTCAAATGTGASSTSASTTATYVIPAAEAGDAFEVQVTASNGTPSATATSAADSPAAPTVGTPGPAITGTVAVNQTLTASAGTWTGDPKFTYAWQRCSGATCTTVGTATTYALSSADAGSSIQVVVTAANAGGSATATSAQVSLPLPPALVAAPGIGGTPRQGQTLTETAAHWNNSPTSTSVTWTRCDSSFGNCAAVGTGASYVPTAADVGGYIEVTEVATNAGGSTNGVSSFVGPVMDPTNQIPVPQNTSLPTISGTAQQGSVLRAGDGGWSENPGTFSYQWVRCSQSCTAIAGATAPSYTVGAGDVGSTVAVVVTAANTGGSSGAIQSAKSTRVTTPTNTGLLANRSALVTDQVVTLTATITSGTSAVPPAGTLTFTNNGVPISNCSNLQLQPSGQIGIVTCQTAFGASTARISAVYAPPGGSLATGSTSGVTTFVVGRASPRLSLTGPGNPGVRTKAVYTVKVAPPSGSSAALNPTGFVRFLDGSRTIKGCGRLRLRRLSAGCTLRYDVLARHRLAVAYGGDANFRATTSKVKLVTPTPQHPTGFVSALMNWTFHYTLKFTTIPQLMATQLAPGMTISLSCQGGGCPFRSQQVHINTQGSCTSTSNGCSVDLVPLLHHARFRPGAILIIRITHTLWIGKYYRFSILAGQQPQLAQNCLAVNSNQPGIGCTTT